MLSIVKLIQEPLLLFYLILSLSDKKSEPKRVEHRHIDEGGF